MTNPYQDKIKVLSALAQKYFQAEADQNPTLQNYYLRQMTYLADRLFMAAFDFLTQLKNEKVPKEADSFIQNPQTPFFTCPHCGKQFTSRRGLATHSRIHPKFNSNPLTLFDLSNGHETCHKKYPY